MTAPAISVLFAYRDRLPQFRHTLQSYQHWYGPTLEGVQLIMVDDTPTDSEALPRLLRELGLEGGPQRVVIVHRDGAHNPGVLYNQGGDVGGCTARSTDESRESASRAGAPACAGALAVGSLSRLRLPRTEGDSGSVGEGRAARRASGPPGST